MVEILLSVAAKVAEYLVDPITLQLSYPFNYHRHVQDLLQKIDRLGHARRKVEELAEEANRRGDQIFPNVQEWLDATREILQTREDFVHGEERASQQGCFHLKSRYNLSKRAMRQGADIDDKLQQARDFGDMVARRPPPPLISSASFTNDGAFPSREPIFNQIMESLRNEQTSIVGVWGMGGVGKTTLARQVAKRAEEEKLFDKVVMASSISQTPNISEIQREIARTLGLHYPEGEDRAVCLMNSLKIQKKILVIIDDIWDKLDLGEIGIPYGGDHKGCKLLLTSREYEVVVKDMKAQQVFHLPHLEAEEARSLFKRTAGDSVESLELKAIADEIVKKCEGLPIAIITIANALKDKSVGEWKNALKELKMAKPINIRGMSKNVYNCLDLSYNRLEGDEVKSLFLLCGLLGGRSISMDHLLLYAKGLDMFQGMYSMEDATNKVITLVQKLIASSLLLHAEEEDNDGQWSLFFDYSFVKMHDVVRDVARSIASKDAHRQYVVSDAIELRELERRGECRNYSGISLECGVKDELPSTLVCPELELFLLNSSFNILRIPEDFFQGVTKLRVLHMSEVSLRVSPSSLGFLSNLRTLCLVRCLIEDMKIIGEMKGLQVLSLEESQIVELPKEIEQLKDLRVLALQYCYDLRIIPLNVISSLSRLECLSIRGCNNIEWVFISEIKDLPGLKTLEVNVRDLSLLPAEAIGQHLINLTRYFITTDDFFVEPLKFARNLSVTGSGSPVMLLKSFSNLFETCQAVTLKNLDTIRNVVYDLAKDNGFPLLERLEIEYCGTIKYIISSSLIWVPPRDTFRRLDRLHLCNLHDLESIFDFHGSTPILLIECFGKLRELSLWDCHKMRCVMSLPMQHGRELNFFPRLQKMELIHLPDLISFYSAAPQNSQLKSMSILFNQQAAFPALEELHVFRLGYYLQALWNNQFPANSFSKLKKLEVELCGGLQKVFPVSLVKGLVQLEKLRIIRCRSLEEIVANEGKDVEDEAAFSIDDKPTIDEIDFNRLKSLHLVDLPNLRGFCSTTCTFRFPSLEDLDISNCPRMEFFCKGVLHISNDTLEEYILGALHYNTQAIHETSTALLRSVGGNNDARLIGTGWIYI